MQFSSCSRWPSRLSRLRIPARATRCSHDIRNSRRLCPGGFRAALSALRASASGGAVNGLELAKIAVYFLIVLALTKPLGLYMRRVFSREKTFLDPLLRPVERLVYRVSGVDEAREQDWMQYTIA